MVEWEVSPCSTCVLIVTASRLRTTFGGSPLGKESSSVGGGVPVVAASLIGERQIGSWSYKTARITEKQKFLQVCWRGRSRIMDGIGRFIAVDNHVTVKVGDLRQETRSETLEKPKFTTDFLGAIIQEGADELAYLALKRGSAPRFSTQQFCDTSVHMHVRGTWLEHP